MKIAIMALGSRGDVQPYLALGKGLKAAGHFVRLITHQNFERLVTSHGLEFYPVKGDVQAVLESPEMLKLLEQGNFLAINAHTAKLVQDAAIDRAVTDPVMIRQAANLGAKIQAEDGIASAVRVIGSIEL